MNKKYIYTIILLVLVIFTSCNDFLERKPKSELTGENFWLTESDAKVGVTAIYAGFADAMAEGLWNWGEFRADNHIAFIKGTNVDQIELVGNKLQDNNTAGKWTDLYITISRANDAIKNIPKISMSAQTKNDLLAEAHTLRAWAYFYCIRVWGDVPLYTEPITSINDGIYRTRTSKDIIMKDVILPDLEKAYFLINKSYTAADKIVYTRINVGLICALQMDVHAWNHNYEGVISVKEERVNPITQSDGKNYWRLESWDADKFVENWRGIFIENITRPTSTEIFFKLAYTRRDAKGRNRMVALFVSSESPRTTVSPKLMDAYIERGIDLRYGDTQWQNWGADNPELYRMRKKFWDDNAFAGAKLGEDSDNDLIMYRYADVTLLYAEALNAQDRMSDAITELNRTRTRAGVPAYTMAHFTDKEELLDAILNERQREFVCEGKRWFDLVRTDRWQQVMEPINGMNDARHVLFPVHRDHINQNPGLQQTPGY